MKHHDNNRRDPYLGRKLFFVALALVLAAVSFFFIRANSKMLKKGKELPFNTACTYKFTGAGFLYVMGNEVRYCDVKKCSDVYSIPVGFENAKLAGSGNLHVAYNDSTMVIIGNKESEKSFSTLASVSIEGLNHVECNGEFIAAKARTGDVDSVLLYDMNGSRFDDYVFDKTQVFDFGFCSSNKTPWLFTAELSLTAQSPVTTITTYAIIEPATTGIILIQNQLVQDIVFTESSVFAITSSNIIRYDRDGNSESYRLISYGYKPDDYSFSSTRAVFLMTEDTAEQPTSMHCYSTMQAAVAEDSMASIKLASGSIGYFTAGTSVFTVTPTEIIKYKANGKLQKSQKLGSQADEVIKLSDKYVLISSENKLYLHKLKAS